MPADKNITIHHATEHNLKAIDVTIPHGLLTVITGVSGSGKSSLAFDTLYKEGRRRYLESFSAYARQFLGKLGRPSVGYITGLSPAIAVDQKTTVRNPRSTVGTMSEIHDYLRLLLARLGEGAEKGTRLQRRMFSFNSPDGACPDCKGLGVQDHIDPELLIADPSKTLREGALVITTPTGYIIYSQVTMDVLNTVCEAHGFDVDIRWKDMTEEQKNIVLYGSDKIKIPYGKHPLESRLKWSGITAKPREEGVYKGILPVMENILRVDRNKNILRFARSIPCAACGGARLKPEALAITYKGHNIAQLAAKTIDELHNYFNKTNGSYKSYGTNAAEEIRAAILERTALLRELGLGYLTLDRESTTLSGGEAQRIRLATQVGSGLRGILYILDEPSIGLHHRDNQRLLDVLFRLRDNGNTVVVVEHDDDTIRAADHLIDMGPGAGVHGGEILFSGPTAQLLEEEPQAPQWEKSRTRAFLTGAESTPLPARRRTGNGQQLKVLGASKHNLKNIDVPFLLGALNVVTGVSGAGKSTLVHHILANSLKESLQNKSAPQGVEGAELIDKIIEIDQSPIGRTPRSNPATYTKLFDAVRGLFASLPEAEQRQWGKGRFSFNVKGGRCETCEGAGLQQIGMHFMGNAAVTCGECGGKRFNDETLEIRYKDKNIYDVLEMSIDKAVEFFEGHPKILKPLRALAELGLGYLALGQSAVTLSGGEAQRVKLASELARPATGNTLYFLDEPTTGLHAADIKILLESLNRLVDKGNTVITVEHHPDFIKSADWVTDLGPGSGDQGGKLVAAGWPEEVARTAGSHTGALLRELFDGRADARPHRTDKSYRTYNTGEPIRLAGVATHNLKNIDVTIPVNKITVITGVSGSGKSSLAFDTLFAEARRRFLNSFSTYARRMMGGLAKADVASCSGLMPAIAVSQKTAAHNPRSTVGTMTDIYDYYRLLYARVGKSTHDKPPLSSMFSFNSHQGACPLCKGLGVVTVCDPEKLVTHPERSLLDGAMDGSKTGKFYGDPHGRYMAILKKVGETVDLDLYRPWRELDEDTRHIAMHGTGVIRYEVTWKYKRKNRVGEHNLETDWKGLAYYVEEEYERKHADHRGQAMRTLMTDETCGECGGHRLKKEALEVWFSGLTIADLSSKTVDESIDFFNTVANRHICYYPERRKQPPKRIPPSAKDLHVTEDLREEVLRRLGFLRDVGLGYLTLDRNSATLSGGEARRIRLAGQLGSGLTGVLYILDEPTIGLHSRDTQRLLKVLKALRDTGNTVVVVEHDEEIIREADHIIDLGPMGGADGGYITAEGSVKEIMGHETSKTGGYLRNPNAIPTPAQRRSLTEGLKITGASANNLKHIDVEIGLGGLVVFTGVSGSGKSTLMFDVIAASAEAGQPVGCAGFNAPNQPVITMDQSGVGTGPNSTPATYTGMFDIIRDLFTATDTARKRGYKKNRFSFNVKGGRCETCQGAGEIRTSMDFLADVRSRCDDCQGRRYNSDTLQCRYENKTIAEVLDMTMDEAPAFFTNTPALQTILEKMQEVGLGYIRLGQPTDTLSGGEAQRLKLVTELLKGKSQKNLYLLDEPTTGLHFEDIQRLLNLFHNLADAGHSLLIIEHHPDIIKNADQIINLGPEGGVNGGEITNPGGSFEKPPPGPP